MSLTPTAFFLRAEFLVFDEEREYSPLWQVASHAQKYFIRLNSLNKKDKRRSSIHDITSVQNTQAHASAPPQYAGGMYPAPMGGMHPSQHGPVGGSSQQFVYH